MHHDQTPGRAAAGERERRLRVGALTLGRRADGGADAPEALTGHAALFDEWTTLYEGRYYLWREVIRPGAFRAAIAEKQDVRCLFNHDANYVLGRTAAGTLALAEDARGLAIDCTAPATGTIRDLVLEPIRRNDVTGQSFCFAIRREGQAPVTTSADGVTVVTWGGERTTIRTEGERTVEERELLGLDLFDVGPVTYPAYIGTDVGLRSRGEAIERELSARGRGRRSARRGMRLRLALAGPVELDRR